MNRKRGAKLEIWFDRDFEYFGKVRISLTKKGLNKTTWHITPGIPYQLNKGIIHYPTLDINIGIPSFLNKGRILY